MAQWSVIDKRAHAAAGWSPAKSFAFAAQEAVVPLLLAELAHAMPQMALAFIPQPDQPEAFQLVGVQSLLPGQNWLVAPDGRWLATYTPAFYRAYPFRLLPIKDQADLALCFDHDSGLWQDTPTDDGKPFFGADGQMSTDFAATLQFLQRCEQQRGQTLLAVNALQQAGVLEPWPLEQQAADGSRQPVNGLWRVDEAALNALPAETLAALRLNGALGLAYAQLFASAQLQLSLPRFVSLQQQLRAQPQAAANVAAQPADMVALANKLTGVQTDDGMLKFNF